MPMTVVITRDVEARYRGFLASAMLEVAPGVYVSPDSSAGVRERIWKVLQDWFRSLGNGAVPMIWRDRTAAGGVALRHLGDPRKRSETLTACCSSRPGKHADPALVP